MSKTKKEVKQENAGKKEIKKFRTITLEELRESLIGVHQKSKVYVVSHDPLGFPNVSRITGVHTTRRPPGKKDTVWLKVEY